MSETQKQNREYAVWRDRSNRPYRTYRVCKKRPLSEDSGVLWRGEDYTLGVKAQKIANQLASGRKTDDPQQGYLFPDWLRQEILLQLQESAKRESTRHTAADGK